ncbi:MetQ/NlpA family ABC transporter substrate-binding protein [Raineyella sp. LH-20]|uniref:MetQ/NlpA family ABC transporter substrate-binding protein n=1 Tax=Raineyella sp. LH-20 TaxID=3081204 RepID=UPI0029549F2A|nr:MetQ/NlpA family ABC transporter substrate-binding protein [Raineyella sp. LH-20]WOP19237.1 MetQ/NlpA family ABC transporter substrate-binding protein [Raineyella sp. LH-20]
MTTRFHTLAAAVAALALSTVGLAGCAAGQETLKISADATPHAEILQYVQDSGQLKDTKIQIETISGEVDPNQLLEAGDVSANFFQHKPYLDDWQAQHKTNNLVSVASTHLEPMSIYSHKYTAVADIPAGSTVAVPKDPTNYARALYVLQTAGLLTMKQPATEANMSTITEADIASNAKQLKFVELDRPQLPRTLDDPQVAASVINSNYAIEAGLTPSKDGLVTEPVANNPYANILVTTTAKQNDPGMKELAAALESPQTAAWIKQKYGDSIVPVHESAK